MSYIVYKGYNDKEDKEKKPSLQTKKEDSRWQYLLQLMAGLGNSSNVTINNTSEEEKKEGSQAATAQDRNIGNQGQDIEVNEDPKADPNYIPEDKPLLLTKDPETGQLRTSYTAARQMHNKMQYEDFLKYMNNFFADKTSYEDQIIKDQLIHFAGYESSYNHSAKNSDPKSTSIGWFGMTHPTRTDLGYGHLTPDEFVNNKPLQIQLAYDLHKRRRAQLQGWLQSYNKTTDQLGLSDQQLMYGMWWNPQAILDLLRYGKSTFTDSLNNDLDKITTKAAT